VNRRSLSLRLLALSILTLLAVVWNQHSPTLFFDHQITLGESLGLFALLAFGWSGLVVGLAAEAVTVQLWGQPLHLLVGIGQLIWLKLFLDHFNGGAVNNDNGRVVPATIAFWLLPVNWDNLTRSSRFGGPPPLGFGLFQIDGESLKPVATLGGFEQALGLAKVESLSGLPSFVLDIAGKARKYLMSERQRAALASAVEQASLPKKRWPCIGKAVPASLKSGSPSR
jgi:hypothetical protein